MSRLEPFLLLLLVGPAVVLVGHPWPVLAFMGPRWVLLVSVSFVGLRWSIVKSKQMILLVSLVQHYLGALIIINRLYWQVFRYIWSNVLSQ